MIDLDAIRQRNEERKRRLFGALARKTAIILGDPRKAEWVCDDVDAPLAELTACRAKNKELHRRAQKAESATLKAQPKPVDTWKSRDRQQEASVRDRMMAAVGRERDREERTNNE